MKTFQGNRSKLDVCDDACLLTPDEVAGIKEIGRRYKYSSNNFRKMHGEPMLRNVHLRKIAKKRIAKLQEEWIRTSLAFMGLGKAAERMTCTTREFIEANDKYVMGFDLADLAAGVDYSDYMQKSIRSYPYWGQPVINQNAIVKIVTSGEEKKNEKETIDINM